VRAGDTIMHWVIWQRLVGRFRVRAGDTQRLAHQMRPVGLLPRTRGRHRRLLQDWADFWSVPRTRGGHAHHLKRPLSASVASAHARETPCPESTSRQQRSCFRAREGDTESHHFRGSPSPSAPCVRGRHRCLCQHGAGRSGLPRACAGDTSFPLHVFN